MKKRSLLAVILTMSLSGAFTSFAGQWEQNSLGWWYQEDSGNYPVNQWKELNSKWYYFNQDGYMISNAWVGNYYLGSDGAMLTNTITPDGYRVGADGTWIQAKNPMAGIECRDKWLMGVDHIEDLGDKYKITGDVSDYQVVVDFWNVTGSDIDWFRDNEPEIYYSLDDGFRKSNVTVYLSKNTQVGFYPIPIGDLDEYTQNSRAKNLNDLFLGDYIKDFAFDLKGDVVTAIYDIELNYVN